MRRDEIIDMWVVCKSKEALCKYKVVPLLPLALLSGREKKKEKQRKKGGEVGRIVPV